MEAGKKIVHEIPAKLFKDNGGYYEGVSVIHVAVVGYGEDFAVYTGAVMYETLHSERMEEAVGWVASHGDKNLTEKEARKLFPECSELSFRG